MMSGGVSRMGFAAHFKVRSTSQGVWKSQSSFSTLGSQSARCSLNDGDSEFFTSPPLFTVHSALEVLYVPRHQHMLLNEEGGIWVWKASKSSKGESVFKRRGVREIAEASGAFEATSRIEGEKSGLLTRFVTNGTVVNRALPEVEGSKSPSKFSFVRELHNFDLAEELQDSDAYQDLTSLERQAEMMKEELRSLDFKLSRNPFEGAESMNFAAILIGLVFIFWLGNFLVPDLIFRSTVFKKESKDPLDTNDPKSGED